MRRESGQIPFIDSCLTRQEFLGVLIHLVTNGAHGCLFGKLLMERRASTEVLPFRTRPIYVHTYFIRRPVAEYATRKPDGNLTRLSLPRVRVWPARLHVDITREGLAHARPNNLREPDASWFRTADKIRTLPTWLFNTKLPLNNGHKETTPIKIVAHPHILRMIRNLTTCHL